MKEVKSVKSLRKIIIGKSGREGLYLEIWDNNILSADILC